MHEPGAKPLASPIGMDHKSADATNVLPDASSNGTHQPPIGGGFQEHVAGKQLAELVERLGQRREGEIVVKLRFTLVGQLLEGQDRFGIGKSGWFDRDFHQRWFRAKGTPWVWTDYFPRSILKADSRRTPKGDKGPVMRVLINGQTLELDQGDITLAEVDAIVNAANGQLVGGGGVDGAIHRRGGPEIMQETAAKYPEGCPTGSAVISGARQLKAKYVIHAVGPVWSGGQRGEAELLAGAYRRCLELAVEHDCQQIAFPALSAGAYRFPMDQAARIALRTTIDFLQEQGKPALVRFVLFDAGAYGAFAAALEELTR